MNKIKILIISGLWDNNNSLGNTFSNLFGNMENIEIANIYSDFGIPNNNIVKKYFQITDKSIIDNLLNKKYKSGKIVSINKNENNEVISNISKDKLNLFRRYRFLFTVLREIIWCMGNWKSKELLDFAREFKPDLIYVPIYKTCYTNKIILFIKNKINIPMIGHISDELYYYNRYEKNPIKNIYQFFVRKIIKKVINKCEFVDCFSYIQKDEYEKIFNIPFKIRYKSANIENVEIKKEYNNLLTFLYTGNLGNERWKNLVEIGKALDKINKNEVKAILNIYSGTHLTKEMRDEFNNCKSINFKGSVSGEEVQKIQSNADVLIHTESFDKKEIQSVRMSLSTKIIDYLAKGKCILAFGPKEVTSIDYFVKNKCGLVIDNIDDLYIKLNKIIENKNLLYDFSVNALETAKNNHNSKILQKNFYEDILSVIKD